MKTFYKINLNTSGKSGKGKTQPNKVDQGSSTSTMPNSRTAKKSKSLRIPDLDPDSSDEAAPRSLRLPDLDSDSSDEEFRNKV